MSDRKVYVNVTVRLIMRVDEGVDVTNVLDEMTYAFDLNNSGATLEDSELKDYEITDSK
jgi:hypothetical protein